MLAPAPRKVFKDPELKAAYFKSIADHCADYKGAITHKSIIQMTITLSLYAAALGAMYLALTGGHWLAFFALLFPTAGLLTRVFIIQHDCGHGSYFKSRKANDRVGRALSLLTWTPYSFWRRTHNLHHASSGNLDKRGYGGIEMVTVKEFENFSPAKQKFYRAYRNIFLLLGLGTPIFIIFIQRLLVTEPFLPEISTKANLKNSWKSIFGLNAALLVTYGAIGYFMGYGTLAMLYLPILVVTSWIGGWLFYIQHQFEDTLWENQKEWSYNEAAVMGSSYYDLPKILQWFTGNIGLHHIHHLNATIPNYRLQQCLDDHPDLGTLNRMTIRDSIACAKLALWDEAQKRMITFKELKALQLNTAIADPVAAE